MDPKITGQNYDQIAAWFQEELRDSQYGLSQLSRAIQFTSKRDHSLDVGCGSTGRFIQAQQEQGFQPEGIDISSNMIALTQQLHPQANFYVHDICTWNPPKKYDLISAWDSTFHLPIDQQEPVLAKLCKALDDQGVLLFTCGSERGERAGGFQGLSFEYSSLGAQTFVEILGGLGCACRHLEYDQYPESHVCIIAQKISQE